MTLERIKLSQAAKDQLVKLKRQTKIQTWNVLCRSLAEPTRPSPAPIPADSNVEMTWQVFGGEWAEILAIALQQRCHNDGLPLDPETLATQFRLHLHRGLGYLAGDPRLKTIADLVAIAEPTAE